MATPAAILQIAVEANTRSAMTSLNKFDAALKRTDKTTATATTRTSALGSASRSVGSHLASAARYAAGAAAAYLSIAQAKDAITTTQDLAKTTAGLNRNLGLSIKTASQWGAVAKSRDVDAKSLTLSFTTLSRRLVDTADALKEGGSTAQSAYAPFKRLGISQEQIIRGSQDLGGFLPTLANAFGDAAGGAERQASAQELLGRGYQSILPLFASGAKGLREQQEWADKYGATLNNETLKAQMDLVAAQRESKVAVLGLQVSFARFLTPALERANHVFQRIAKIVGSDKLTEAEKFEKLGKVIGKWADKAHEAFVKIMPKIISAAADKAPAVAGAFVKGFMNADVWGKLALGTFIFAKAGGAQAVGKVLGTRIGKGMGKGIPIGIVLALPAIGIAIGTWIRHHSDDIELVGKKIGEFLVNGIIDAVNFGIRQINEAMDKTNVFAALGVDAPNIGEIGHVDFTKVEKATVALGDLIDHLDKAKKHGKDFNDGYSKAVKQAADTSHKELGQRAVQSLDALGDTSKGTGKSVRDDLKNTARELGRNANDFGGWSKSANKDLDKTGDATRDLGRRGARNFDGMRKVVDNLGGAWSKGLDLIGGNTKNLLNKLKVDFDYSIAKSKGSNPIDKGANFFQRGGHINLGAPSGDSVPAMLERGEYVLNREAVKKVGTKQLDAINFAAAPRFQKGGSVAAMAADADRIDAMRMNYVWGGSHGSSPAPHGGPFDCSSAVSHILQHGGGYDIPTMVSGQLANFGKPGKGPVTIYANPEHVLMSINDRFWGTSSSNPGGGPGWIPTPSSSYLSGFAARVPDGIVGMATKVARQILKGPKGPWREGGQAAFDKARSAANAFIMKQGSPLGGNSNLDMLTGPGKTVGASVYGFGEAGTGTVGASGRSLIGVPAYAELDMGTALGGLPFGKQLKITAPGGRSMVGVKEDIGLGGGSVGGLPRAIDLWRDLAQPLGLDGSFLGQVKVQGLQKGGFIHPANYLKKGGGPKFTGSMTTWDPDGSGIKISEPFKTAEKMRAVLDRIGLIDERIQLADGRAGIDGLFTDAERQHSIQLNTDLLRSLIETRDFAQFGLEKSTQMLGRNSTPSWQKKLIRDVVPTFTETLLDTQGISGKGGRIFDTLIRLANLQNTVPDAPAGRGTMLEAIESSISLAGLTPDLSDDIAGYQALVSYWEQALAQLQASGGSFSDIGSAASALKSARDTLAGLTGSSSGTDNALEIKTLELEQAMATIRRLNVGIAQNSVFMGAFAEGGVAMVGERGPELAHLPSGTRIHSADDTRSMLEPQVTVNINGSITPDGSGRDPVEVLLRDKRLDARIEQSLNGLARRRSLSGAGQIGAGR